AGQRREVADLDLFGLAITDRRKSERRGAGKGGAGLQQGSSAGAGHRWSPPKGRFFAIVPLQFRSIRECERRFSIVGRYFRRRSLLSMSKAPIGFVLKENSPRLWRRIPGTAEPPLLARSGRCCATPGWRAARSGRKFRARRSRCL